MSEKIRFFYEDIDYRISDQDWIFSWLESIFQEEGKDFELIEYILCSDPYLLEINKEYLDHDYFTDIITFPLSQDPIEATIYISVDRVRDNAREFEQGFEDELHRVIAHGILHMIGYNDKTEEESLLMRKRENAYLEKRNKHKTA